MFRSVRLRVVRVIRAVVVFLPFLYSVSRFLTGLGSMANFLTTFIVSTSRINTRLFSRSKRAVIVVATLARWRRCIRTSVLRLGGRLRFRHWRSHLILIKSDVRVLKFIQQANSFCRAEEVSSLLIDVQRHFVSAIIICKHGPLVVFVIIVGLKCRPWFQSSLDCLLLHDFVRV